MVIKIADFGKWVAMEAQTYFLLQIKIRSLLLNFRINVVALYKFHMRNINFVISSKTSILNGSFIGISHYKYCHSLRRCPGSTPRKDRSLLVFFSFSPVTTESTAQGIQGFVRPSEGGESKRRKRSNERGGAGGEAAAAGERAHRGAPP